MAPVSNQSGYFLPCSIRNCVCHVEPQAEALERKEMNLKFTLEAVNKYANDPAKKDEVVELLSYEPGSLSTQLWLKCFAGYYPFPALSGLESYYVKQRIGAAQSTLGAYWKELDSINSSNGGWGDLEKFREFLTAMMGLSEKFDQHHLNPVWKVSNL